MKNYDVLLENSALTGGYDVIISKRASTDSYDVILRGNQFVGSITVDNLPIHYSSGDIEAGLAVCFTIDADGYFFGRPFDETIEGKIGVGWSIDDVLKIINTQADPGVSVGFDATPSKQIYTPLEQGIMTGMGISGLFKNMAFEDGMQSGLTMSFAVNDDDLLIGSPLGDFANGMAIGMSVSGDAIKDSYYFLKPSSDIATDMSVGDTQTTVYNSIDGPVAIGIVGGGILRRYRKINEMTEKMSAYADIPMGELIYITIAE